MSDVFEARLYISKETFESWGLENAGRRNTFEIDTSRSIQQLCILHRNVERRVVIQEKVMS